MKKILALVLVTLSACGIGYAVRTVKATNAYNAANTRTIKQIGTLTQTMYSPITYSLRVGDQNVEVNKPFVASSDFYKDLKINVTNRDGRAISYVSFLWVVTGKEKNTKLTYGRRAAPLTLGEDAVLAGRVSPKRSSLYLAPGETKTFKAIDVWPVDPITMAEKQIEVDLHNFEFRAYQVVFEDKVMWELGKQFRLRADRSAYDPINDVAIGKEIRAIGNSFVATPNKTSPCPYSCSGWIPEYCTPGEPECWVEIPNCSGGGCCYDIDSAGIQQCKFLGQPCYNDRYVLYYYYCGAR